MARPRRRRSQALNSDEKWNSEKGKSAQRMTPPEPHGESLPERCRAPCDHLARGNPREDEEWSPSLCRQSRGRVPETRHLLQYRHLSITALPQAIGLRTLRYEHWDMVLQR